MAQWPTYTFDGSVCSVDIDSGEPFTFDASTFVKVIKVVVDGRPSDISSDEDKYGEVEYDVYPLYPFNFLKRMIMVKQGLPVEKQKLMYEGNVLATDEEQTLEDYGIVHNGTTIDLLEIRGEKPRSPPRFIRLKIKRINGDCTLYEKVPPGYTVRALKKMIERREGFEVAGQVLVYGEENLLDLHLLRSYFISDKCLLHLGVTQPAKFIKLKIKELHSDCIMYDDVPPGSTVMDLKKMIEMRQGWKVKEQVLVYGEVDLLDDVKLTFYSIEENSLLHLGIIGGSVDN